MDTLENIINWRLRDDLTTLSGQPSEDQFALIKSLGVTDVINLGPHSNKGALADEPATLGALGLTYTYIPVDFGAPTQANFDMFCAGLDRLHGRKIHVHCIYNARVSAFYYRYALEGRGGDITEALTLMDGIWRPGSVWSRFIGLADDGNRPNKYEGYEY